MITSRYLAACGAMSSFYAPEQVYEPEHVYVPEQVYVPEPPKEKIYADCDEFMADVKEIESKISKDGFRSRSSVMSSTTSSYNHETGNFEKGPPKDICANFWIIGNLKYFGEIEIGELVFKPRDPRIEIRYLSLSNPINSGYVGLKSATPQSVSVAEAYDIFKENLMSLDEAANMVVPLWCAASVGKDGLKFVQGVDPTRLNDPKYIKREFTAKRAADLLTGKIVVVQYRGKGRTHTSSGSGCGVYRLQKAE